MTWTRDIAVDGKFDNPVPYSNTANACNSQPVWSRTTSTTSFAPSRDTSTVHSASGSMKVDIGANAAGSNVRAIAYSYPVKQGCTYEARGWAYGNRARFNARYVDAAGALIAPATTPGITAQPAAWEKFSIQLGAVPANAVRLHVYVGDDNPSKGANTVYFDDIEVLETDPNATPPVIPHSNQFARVAGNWVELAALGEPPNLVTNPGFENGITGWAQPGTGQGTIAASTKHAHSGTGSALFHKAVAAGRSAAFRQSGLTATAGEPFTLSMWCFVETGAPQVHIGVLFSDAGGAAVGARIDSPNVTLVPNTWVLVSLTGTAPAGSVHANLVLSADSTVPAGTDIWVDDVVFANGPSTYPGYARVAGAWKGLKEGWARVGADWKKLWPQAEPPFQMPQQTALELWFDASDTASFTADANGLISEIRDKGVHSIVLRDVKSPGQPMPHHVTTPHPAFRFTGTEMASSGAVPILKDGGGFTAFIVCETPAWKAATWQRIVHIRANVGTPAIQSRAGIYTGLGPADWQVNVTPPGATMWPMNPNAQTGWAHTGPSPAASGRYLYQVRVEGGAAASKGLVRINDGEWVKNDLPAWNAVGTGDSDAVALGATANHSQFFHGDINEVIIYKEILTDVEMAAVAAHLTTKWNLP